MDRCGFSDTLFWSWSAESCSKKEIAARLNVSPEAIKKRLSRIYDKLDVHGRREAVAVAVARGILGQRSTP